MRKTKTEQLLPSVPFLNATDLERSLMIVRSIRHPLRQKMLQLLHSHREMTVTDLYIKLRLEQSLASQHLALLRRSGVVKTRREGKFIFYSIDYARLEQMSELLSQLGALTN